MFSACPALHASYVLIKSGTAENTGEDIYLDVPLRVSEDSETNMQTDVDGMNLQATVVMDADTSYLQYQVDQARLTAYVDTVIGGGGHENTKMHSHATGLDRVPYDGYLARLHSDEMVLRSTDANAVRSGLFGGTGRLESLMTQLLTLTQQMVANTGRSPQVVLDSGVLVGQIAPAMDARLGTITNRKGRRN